MRRRSLMRGDPIRDERSTTATHESCATTAMEKHQNSRRIAPWNNRVFARYAVHIDRSELHIGGYGPNRTNLIEAPSSLSHPNGRGLEVSSARTVSISL